MANWYMTQNNRRPSITAQLYSATGPIDLTGATGVKFVMSRNGVSKIDASATIVTAATGKVRYDWGATDTNTPGVFNAHFEITWSSGITQDVPNDRYDQVIILPDLR